MEVNTRVTNEIYAQQRYSTTKSYQETFQMPNENSGEEGADERMPMEYYSQTRTVEEYYQEMSLGKSGSAVVEDAPAEKLEPLGLGFVFIGGIGQGMTASQVIRPDSDETIIRVKVNNETYDVNPAQIDPKHATAIEMFALCQYADANGTGVNSTFGSWNALKSFMAPAGQVLEFSSLEEAATRKMDWNATVSGSNLIMEKKMTGETISASDFLKMFLETHKLTDDKEDKDDWREMSDEHWNKLLASVDGQIEDMKEAVQKETKKATEKADAEKSVDKVDILTARYTTFIRKGSIADPASKTGEVIKAGYIDRTFYTHEGIVCVKAGYNSKVGNMEDKFNWKVDFNDSEDYDRAMKFLDRIPEDDNTVFTTREQFWQDFVDGKIDEDEFFEFYETLDHGVANFIKQDENGKNYIDNEMMNSKYFKYFGLQQVTTVPWDDLQRGLEQSALRDRGYIHEDNTQDDSFHIYEALKEAFASNGTDEFRFYGEDSYYSLDEWVQEIIRRAHMGLMDSLFVG